MSGAAPAYRLGSQTRRLDGGRTLLGGWPPRRLRLSAAGATALDALLAGRAAPGAAQLARRLTESGILDPIAGAGTAPVTFVVPVRDGGARLAALVRELTPHGEVIVVDDGSRDGSPAAARRAGARVVANAGAPGPAGARNHGCELAATELVAFIDADCLAAGDWARPLAALLAADPQLALVAPRIQGARCPGRLARWERERSPLDMGTRGGLVGPGRRVSFVPSAAMVARCSALTELGGFDPGLRWGEDVDLVWRALAAGWSVRYAPEVVVEHPGRPTLPARARQHFEYGTSAAALERRHPGAAAPLRPGRFTIAPALLATGPAAAGALLAPVLALVAAARQEPEARPAIAILALAGQLEAGRSLARAVAREWLPVTVLAAMRWRRARRVATVALAADLAFAVAPDPPGAPLGALLRLADNAAYATGLWLGALSQRSPRVLLPARPGRRPRRVASR